MHICDIVYKKITEVKHGVYVDCGTNNGLYNSKTKQLDDKGWTGFCIEANPDQFKQLVKNRPRATCINTALYDVDNVIVTLTIDLRASGGGSTILTSGEAAPNIQVKKPIQCNTQTLNSVLEKNNITTIDYLKVDIEGVDAKVLLPLDLDRFNIKFICYEQLPKFRESEEYKQLEEKLTQAGFIKIKKLGLNTEYFKGIDIIWYQNY